MTYPLVGHGRHPALDYSAYHSGPLCDVELIMGTTAVWVFCKHCRVATQLDAIAQKIDTAASVEVRP